MGWKHAQEGHLKGLADLIKGTSADGVVLDTKGESSRELQEAADQVKPGVIMYSEGMAVPKDMQGIISGRVHNALYYPPMLNLNKFIRPDFAIFRVAEVYKEPIQRNMQWPSLMAMVPRSINLHRAIRSGRKHSINTWAEQRILRENTSFIYLPLHTAHTYTPR